MAKVTGLGLTPKTGAVPVPDSTTLYEVPLALSTIVSEAVRLPIAAGVNVTFTVVLLPGVSVIGSVPAVKAKSAAFVPVIDIERFRLPVLVLVITTGCEAPVTPTA